MCETNYNDTMRFWKTKHTTNSYSLIKTNKARHKERTRYIIKTARKQLLECASVCELGCGNGRNLHFLSLCKSGLALSGNDIDPNVTEHIRQAYPDVLDKAAITVADTCQYLKDMPEVDMIFTYGHLMHIPDDKIMEVCELINQKAIKYILIYEALPQDTSYGKQKLYINYRLIYEALPQDTSYGKQKLYNNYRWGRNYSTILHFPDFELILGETMINQRLYLFQRED